MLNFSLTKNIRRVHQPKREQIRKWLAESLTEDYQAVNINITIVTSKRSQELNLQYRGRDYPTNVISLEYSESRDSFSLLYGDIFLCDDIIVEEANKQQKDILAHYAHMVIHGILHLQGFEHQTDIDATKMEDLESHIMERLEFANPYSSK